jgi:hypothetical protein
MAIGEIPGFIIAAIARDIALLRHRANELTLRRNMR